MQLHSTSYKYFFNSMSVVATFVNKQSSMFIACSVPSTLICKIKDFSAVKYLEISI